MTTSEERLVIDLGRAAWFKSSYSDAAQQCLEVATNLPGIVPVRDSKAPDRPALILPRTAFRAFVSAVGAGEFSGV
jgi:hypothetical protein